LHFSAYPRLPFTPPPTCRVCSRRRLHSGLLFTYPTGPYRAWLYPTHVSLFANLLYRSTGHVRGCGTILSGKLTGPCLPAGGRLLGDKRLSLPRYTATAFQQNLPRCSALQRRSSRSHAAAPGGTFLRLRAANELWKTRLLPRSRLLFACGRGAFQDTCRSCDGGRQDNSALPHSTLYERRAPHHRACPSRLRLLLTCCGARLLADAAADICGRHRALIYRRRGFSDGIRRHLPGSAPVRATSIGIFLLCCPSCSAVAVHLPAWNILCVVGLAALFLVTLPYLRGSCRTVQCHERRLFNFQPFYRFVRCVAVMDVVFLWAFMCHCILRGLHGFGVVPFYWLRWAGADGGRTAAPRCVRDIPF